MIASSIADAHVWCSLTGLSDADVSKLQSVVDEQVQEYLGMAMIYAVVAAAQEWLRDKVYNPYSSSLPPKSYPSWTLYLLL